jgi:acetyl/propionyl-CoA carboxylase alpha subunit
MKHDAWDLTQSIDYRSAGTVEFIYDIDAQTYYFLEVNTRLQVEYPVTEAVTGFDLVKCMLDIAQGNHQIFRPDLFQVEPKNVAIEARIYAEDPLQEFSPCAGQITDVQLPTGLRFDTWIESGTLVSASFDPLLGKLIATGKSREEALENLQRGLAVTRIEGIQTNLEYLRQVVASSKFQSGEYTTKYLNDFRLTSFEVIDTGSHTAIQDYPGRVGFGALVFPLRALWMTCRSDWQIG